MQHGTTLREREKEGERERGRAEGGCKIAAALLTMANQISCMLPSQLIASAKVAKKKARRPSSVGKRRRQLPVASCNIAKWPQQRRSNCLAAAGGCCLATRAVEAAAVRVHCCWCGKGAVLWRVWRVWRVQRAAGDVQHENQLKTSLAASPSPLPSLLPPPPSGVVGKRQRRKLISITSNKASQRRREALK